MSQGEVTLHGPFGPWSRPVSTRTFNFRAERCAGETHGVVGQLRRRRLRIHMVNRSLSAQRGDPHFPFRFAPRHGPLRAVLVSDTDRADEPAPNADG